MTLRKNSEFYISKLIVKSVLDQLSEEETIKFESWLNIPGNQKFYNRILNEEHLKEKTELYRSLDKEVAYQNLIKRIEDKRHHFNIYPATHFKNFFKYAAVALLLLTAGYFAFYNSDSVEQPESIFTKVLDLKPGYNKATLILEDGTEIDLEKNEFVKQQTLAKIKNQDNTLIYKYHGKPDSVAGSETIRTNTLFVPIGGIYKLVLPDGSSVWLNSSTSLRYPTAFNGDQRVVELSGEAYFDVVKNENKPFIVKTKSRDILVLGTSFNISAYNDDGYFAATLSEGKIKLTHEDTESVFLKPGEQALVAYTSLDQTQVLEVDAKLYSTWKDGTFFFENESLDNILRKVGRWYDFKIEFSDPSLKKINFTGLASKEFPAKVLLDRISKSSNIIYEINQNVENQQSIIKISKK